MRWAELLTDTFKLAKQLFSRPCLCQHSPDNNDQCTLNQTCGNDAQLS